MPDAALVWLRRDLRCEDHAALHHALRSARRVYCAFVFDREILEALPTRRDRRVEFIRDSLVAQVSQAIVALRRGQLPPAQGLAVADQADTVAGQIAADPDLGPERHDLAAFIRAAAQVLRGQPWPPVPQGYGSVVAQIDEEAGGES